ncbi:MAG: sulfite oxidase heme-binding subunit YedZ [Longimicrobiaceae bacterium]
MKSLAGTQSGSAVGSSARRTGKGGGGWGRTPHGWGGVKGVVWVLCLLPLTLLVWDAFTDGLGAEPIEAITHRTGWWGLTLLLVTLAVTPVRRLTGWNRLIQLRRLLGLFAFFYVCLHFLTYLFDQDFALGYIVEDVVERPYITVGFTAFLLLIPLAITSTKGMIRRLGKRWQRLHRLIYLIAGLGVLHFLWLVKADVREPLLFGAALAVLLAFRLPLLRNRSR